MKPVRFAPDLRPLLIAVALFVFPAEAQNLSSVSLSPTSVTGGTVSTGTVTLSANAPTGGKVVALSSGSTGVATVPSSVTVAVGTKTKTFTVSTSPQASNASSVISGVLGTVTKTATLSVSAPAMSAASVAPTSVTGGASATLTVTLTGNAPSAGTVVTLTSSNTQAATLPPSVTVLAGAKTGTAAVTTLGVDANTTVTLTATAAGVAKTASLTVARAALASLAISPSTIPGAGTAIGTLTLSGPTGPSGASVTLTSSKTSVATVPSSKMVTAGQTTATFTVTGTSLPAGGTTTLTATLNGVSKTANVALQPSAALQAVTLAASSIRGGQPVAGTITLSAAAPSGGVVVNLTSSNTAAATVPASVTVPQGQTTAGLTVTTAAVDSAKAVTITGTSSGVTKTAPLTVEPAVLTGLTILPPTISAGTTAIGTLSLDGPAGPTGATIALVSNDTNVATVPASALITAGQTTGTFTITGAAVTGDAATTISAVLASETQSADITVTRTIGTLTGTVRDASTGFTLPSARVVLVADPAWETSTDGNGHYQLSDVPVGLHTVEVSHGEFSSATSSPVTVANGQSVTVPPVSLTPNPGTIFGTISDRDNGGQPLAGALVTEATGRHAATTDGNGHYELTGLTPGFTYLVIYRSGYRPVATSELSVDAGQALEANVGIAPVWTEDQPGTVEGIVRDYAGNPVGGAVVSTVGVAGITASTGADGRYAFTVPAADGYVFEAEKAGYQRTLSRTLRASAGNRPFHIAQSFDLSPANATGTVELRTFDPVSRNPFRGDLWFRTPSGLWHAPVFDVGSRTVTGVPAGLVWDCLGQRVLPAGGTLTVRCTGEAVVPAGSPRWAAGGLVMNRYTFEPVPGATVTFVNGVTVVPVTTDGNGLFSYASGQVGDYSATASAPGFLTTDPWVFTAVDNQADGAFYGAVFGPEMLAGSVSITAPAEGAVLTAPRIALQVSLSPGRSNDQLLWVSAWPSAGNVTSVTPAYSADGMSAVITIEGAFPNGPLTIGLEAVTQSGAGFTIERNLTVSIPTHPTGLGVSPSTVPGGSVATGTVTVDPPAPAGGALVTLSSSSPAVTVPPSVSIAAGQTSRTFEIVATAVTSQTVATITASVGAFTASAILTVNPTLPPPVISDLAEGGLSGWQAFADPPFVATVSLETTRVRVGSSSLRFVTDSGFDCGVRYIVPGGAHWDLRGVRFLTFWSFGDNTEAFQGEQPVVVLRGPGGSIRLKPPAVQTVNGAWRFHRVPLGETSDWIVTTDGAPSLGDITSFEIHQDVWGAGMTVFYDGVAFTSDVPEDLAEGTAALWGTFASDNTAASVVDDAGDVRSGESALRFDTASGFDTGLVFPKGGSGKSHWDLSDVRSVTVWIRADHEQPFQGNYPVLVLRSPSGLVRYEPGDALLDTPGWRFYEIPLDGTFPWTRTQEGTPDLTDVTAIELHGDIWGSGFRLYLDGVSLGRPLPLVKLPSASTLGGSTPTAAVFISDAAPAGGRTVLLATSDPGIASVPTSIVVPEGARSATFPVTAGFVAIGTPVSITVTDRGFSARTDLRVDPVVDVTGLTLATSSTIGGLPVAGTVTLGAPAWTGGTAVTLTSSNQGAASVPSIVTVPAGATTASFSVTTSAVASNAPVTISANAGAATAAASLTVLQAPPPELSSIFFTPSTVLSGASPLLTVSLTAPAPVEGVVVALTAFPAGLVSFPSAVTVPAGTTTVETTMIVPAATGQVTITLTATVGSSVRTAGLTVSPPAGLLSVSAAPGTVTAGGSIYVVVSLVSVAPSGGKTILLASSAPDSLTVPATVTVAEGSTTSSIAAAAPGSAPESTVTITATDGSIQKTASVVVNPLTRVSALSFAASGGFPGESVTGTLTLTAAAPVGGYSVDLVSSLPAVISVPASVVVPAGTLSTTFQAAVAASGSGGVATVSASKHGVTKQATVAGVTFLSLSVFPAVALPRAVVHLGLNLTSIVPAGRVVDLTLASSNPVVASVPATAQIPASSSWLLVPVTQTEVAADTTVEFTVTALGVSRTATLALETLKVLSVAPRSGDTTVPACSIETMRITTNAAAPAGGATFQLQVENGTPYGGTPIEGSSPQAFAFLVPAGASTLDVSTRASWTLEPRQLVTTVRLGPSEARHTMAIQAGMVSISAAPSTAPRGSTARIRLGNAGGSSCDGGPSFDAPAASSNPTVLPVSETVRFIVSNPSFSGTSRNWYLDLPVPPTAASGVARLTFSVFGTTASVDVTVPDASLSKFSLNPTAAPVGSEVTGVVTLDAPAPAGGITVMLQSSDPSKATVPALVEIPAGISSTTFAVTPHDTATGADSVITATLGGGSRAVTFRALPSNAATIVGRIVDGADYDVEAPVSGATVVLSPGPGQFVTGTDGSFRLHAEPGTSTVRSEGPGFIAYTTNALSLAASQNADLGTIRARRPGGSACRLVGWVRDPQGTPVDGADGVLEGYDVSVRTNGAGAYEVSLPYKINRYRMTFSKPGYPTWTQDVTPYVFGPQCISGNPLYDFILDPNPRPSVAGGSFLMPTMLSGKTARLETYLSGPSSSEDAKVSVTQITPGSYYRSFNQFRIPQGRTGAGLYGDVYLPNVTEVTTVEYALFYGGVTKRTSIEVVPETASISCPNNLTGATTGSCNLNLLPGPAPSGGAVVPLTSSNAEFFSVPASVTVPEGQTSVTFPVTIGRFFVYSLSATLKGLWAGGWGEGSISAHRPDVSSIGVSQAAIVGGGGATGTVALQGPAYATGQTTVTLESTLPAIIVPATVTVAGGASTATFPIGTAAVTQPVSGMIIGRLTMLSGAPITGAGAGTASVLVTPSGLGLACTPTELLGGFSASCTVSLPGSPAPAGGTAIALTSMPGVVTVPTSVTVPQGSYSTIFTATTSAVASTTDGFVRATLGADVAEVTLTVRQSTLHSLESVHPTTVTGGFRTQAYVSLDGYAPAGGILVQLSSASTAVTLPASVLIPEGAVSKSFELTTASVAALTEVVLSASSGSVTVTKTFTIKPQNWQLSPLAPGRTLAGSGEVTLYGTNFLPTDTIQLSGPVYSLAAPDVALCDEPAGVCPTVAASESSAPGQSGFGGGNRIVFTVPATLTPGYYTVRARSAAGVLSSGARWLLLADPSPVVSAVAPEKHGLARPITSGQTVTGTFVENGDTSGSTNDFNLFYFVAAAGTRVSVRLERADVSLPWEYPDSLDPQIAFIAPDGFVYENEGRQDVQPTTDLNAEVTNLVLPQTGMWLIAASTTRGHGDYRLSYTMTPPGSVPYDQQIVAFAGRGTMARVGTDLRLTLAAMDPRGYLLSGAGVSFNATYPDASVGAVEWPTGRSTFTAVDGLAQQSIRTTTRGAVNVAVYFDGMTPTSAVFPPDPDPALKALVESTLATLPQYQPLEHHPYSVLDVDPDGNVSLELGPVRTFKPSRPSRPRTEWKSGAGGPKALDASPAPMPELEPDAVPRPLPYNESLVAPTCFAPRVFRHEAVDGPELKTPYTVTLEDLTPRIGETLAPGLVGAKGIEGHRIEKTIRLKIDVKDRDGNPPPHPVLLRLAVGGPRPGTLILDPDGARSECREAFVVWHAYDAQGNVTTTDLFVEYRLGTLSLLPGVEPDPDNPGQVKPVWGVTEVLGITTEVITSEATLLSLKTFPVLPQPGRPESLVDWDGPPEDDRWEWWNGYHTYFEPTKQARTVSLTNYNAYTLVDKYRNTVWGCRDTTTQHGGTRLTVELPYQDLTGPDFRAYALKLQWWADGTGQMPQGATSVGIRVSYPASQGDWSAGVVATSTLIDLQGGPQTQLKKIERYEARFGMDDGTFPISVSPTAHDETIPNVEPGPAPAPTRSLESHRRMALVLLTGTEAPSMREIFRAPHHPWEWTGGSWVERPAEPAPDPRINVTARPRLKLKLINANGYVQTAAGFKVHFCPRFDHEGSPAAPEWACPTGPLESSSGVIGELRMNSGVVGSGDPPSPDASGYLGLELTTAPTAPGTYYVYVESLDKDVKIRDQSNLHLDDTPDGQFQGGFALCTVQGAEFLDANFARIKPLVARQATPAYLRYVSAGTPPDSRELLLRSYRSTGPEFGTPTPITVLRQGKSNVALGQLTLVPEGDPPAVAAAAGGRMAVLAPPVAREVPPCRSRLVADAGGTIAADTPVDINCKLLIEWVSPEAPDVPLAEQHTVIEGVEKNYAEKTYLRVSVVNPHKENAPVRDADVKCVRLRELPMDGTPGRSTQVPPLVFDGVTPRNAHDNNGFHGGDVLDSPGLELPVRDGVSAGRDGSPVPFVRAVARRRRDQFGELIPEFGALVLAAACPSTGRVEDSDAKYLELWVDQQSFFPLAQGPTRHPACRGVMGCSVDWIEKQAAETFSAAGLGLDEELSFSAVQRVFTDAANNTAHRMGPLLKSLNGVRPYPSDYYEMHIVATEVGLRWGLELENAPPGPFPYKIAGVTRNTARERGKFLEAVLSHEARHALQFKVMSEGEDSDNDGLVSQPIWNGVLVNSLWRIADVSHVRSGGLNSDFDLRPGVPDSPPVPDAVIERDATRAERHLTTLEHGAFDLRLLGTPWTVPVGSSQSYTIEITRNPQPEFQDLSMLGVLVSHQVTSGACQVFGPGRAGAVFPADANGIVTLSILGPGAPQNCGISFKVVRPAGLTQPEQEGPLHEISVAVQ